MQTISETELARNTRKVLDTVVSLGETVVVERNHMPIAQIVPAEQMMTAAQALAGLTPMLASEQAAAWLRESKGVFSDEVHNPWDARPSFDSWVWVGFAAGQVEHQKS